MAEQLNEEADSQSSQLDVEDLQKVVGDGGNNACGSSMAGGEVNVITPSGLLPCFESLLTLVGVPG